MNRRSLLIPLGVFGVLVLVLAVGFTLKDPHLLPSQMINKPFPAFTLKSLENPNRTLTEADIKGKVSLVNVWATWCANCVIENPELLRIRRETDLPIYGINYNDDPAEAIKWLAHYKSPYDFNIVDHDGRLGIDLGVYGAPETFLVDANGVIRLRHVGIVSREDFEDKFLPAIRSLTQEGAGS